MPFRGDVSKSLSPAAQAAMQMLQTRPMAKLVDHRPALAESDAFDVPSWAPAYQPPEDRFNRDINGEVRRDTEMRRAKHDALIAHKVRVLIRVCLSVCLYCMHACMFVFMYVYMYVCMYVCMYV